MGRSSAAIAAAIFAAILLTSPAARADDLLAPAQFRDVFAAAVKAADPSAQLTVKSDLELETGTGWIYLGNAYARYKADPRSLQAIVDQYVRQYAQTLGGAAEATAVERDKLVLLIRSKGYVDATARHTASGGQAPDAGDLPIARPIAGDVVAIVALDEPERYSFPPRKEVLKALGGDAATVLRLAQANSHKRLGAIEVKMQAPGVTEISSEDPDMGSSLLLDEEVWRRPDVVAAAAHPVVLIGKTSLLAVEGSDVVAVQRLRMFATEQSDNPLLISQELYARQADGAWTVLPQ